MNNGIIFFRAQSPYPGDQTRNASLTSMEMDQNMLTLEGRDVKSVAIENRDIVLTLYNGEKLIAPDAIPADKNVSSISFDEKKGLLIYKAGNETHEVYLGTAHSTAVDDTLSGNGTKASPVSIARTMRPGQYRPVKTVVTGALNESCRCKEEFKPGDRIITIERISDYGLLYNYDAVQKIACELLTKNSPWRIPSKADFDDMLNGIEPCEGDANHTIGTSNRELGRWAGKLLKSVDKWRVNNGCTCDDDMPCFAIDDSEDNMAMCPGMSPCDGSMYCGETTSREAGCKRPNLHGGLDKYGFCATPAGSATDDACNFLHFTERAIFWTATNYQKRNAYVKQLAYNRDGVLQDMAPVGMYYSLRLVKDYNGSNYNGSEEILGQSYPTVLMPSKTKGAAIWTAVNFSYNNCNLKALTPNNGCDITETTHFFINEWDGQKWLRNELREGESVVVLETPEGDTNVEYQVVNNRLVNTNQRVFEKVLDNVKDTIDNQNEQLNKRLENVESDVESIQGQLNDGLLNLGEAVNGVKSELEETIENKFKEAEDQVGESVKNLDKKIDNVKEELDKKIDDTKQDLVDSYNEDKKQLVESLDETQKATDEKIEALDEKFDDFKLNIDKAVEDSVKNLNDKILDSVNEVDKKVDDVKKELDEKIEDANSKIEECTSHIIESEGTEYDPSEGVLTIKARDEENDVKVQMSYDFGTF